MAFNDDMDAENATLTISNKEVRLSMAEERVKWIEACEAELQSLQHHNVFEEVSVSAAYQLRDLGGEILPAKCVVTKSLCEIGRASCRERV